MRTAFVTFESHPRDHREPFSWPSRAVLVTVEGRSRYESAYFGRPFRLLRTPHSLASRFCCIAAVIKSSSHPPTTGLEGRWIKGFKAWEDEARHPPIILLWIIGYVNLRVRKMAWKVIEESKKKDGKWWWLGKKHYLCTRNACEVRLRLGNERARCTRLLKTLRQANLRASRFPLLPNLNSSQLLQLVHRFP